MFESVAIRRSTEVSGTAGVDLGSLAEAILFYGQTNLLVDRGTMRKLLHECGPETTLRLVEDGYVNARYAYWNPGIKTDNAGTLSAQYSPMTFTVGHNFEQEIRDLWEEQLGRSGRLRRLRNRFVNSVPLLEPPVNFNEDVASSFSDQFLVEDAAREVITTLAPGYRLPTGFFFRAEPLSDNRVRIATNLDIAAASEFYRAFRGQGAGELTPAQILAELADIQADLYVAATLGTDCLTSDMSSKLYTLRTSRALASAGQRADILSLSNLAFEGHSIREVINSGERRLEEFFPVLDRSQQFRDWLRNVPPDANLARSYFQECTRDSWVEKLPARVFRWALVLLASLHAPLAGGAALSAFDSLLLDRLGHGWRPDQFVGRQIRPFVSGAGG